MSALPQLFHLPGTQQPARPAPLASQSPSRCPALLPQGRSAPLPPPRPFRSPAPAPQAVGTVGATVTIALSGVQATGQVGTEGVSTTVPVTGIAATGAVGTVVPVVTVSLSGNGATGAVGTVTAGAPPIVIIDDTHDGRRFKKQLERERKLREKKKQSIIDAFERIVEGRPEIAEEIAAPFIVLPIAKTAVKTINYDALFADLDRVQRIWDLHLELDDEDVLTLL
jgi:hypothetical protein